MAHLRYVRSDETLERAKQQPRRGPLNNTVRSVRAVYETEPEIAAALLPKPLEPLERPEIFVQFAHVAMHVSEENTVTIGAATVAVRSYYKGRMGGYVLAMPMEGEFVVISGREIYGEPKKIGAVDFDVDGDRFKVAVTRHDIPFLEIQGSIGESKGSAEFTEHFFCHKALPAIDGSLGFDGDVLLTQLNWKRNYTDVYECKGDIILRESPYDPLVDVPVRKLVSLEYAEGATQTNGEILEKIPGEWIKHHIHQRFDDGLDAGVDLELASEHAHA
ncbi:MAG: acetoacetate decarboxylase family protein [Pseudomonadota bacterium]